jgi:hypothetical protein
VRSDSQLIGKEATGEEAVEPEAIAIGSGLKLILDEELLTTEQNPGSDSDVGGRQWPLTASRGG